MKNKTLLYILIFWLTTISLVVGLAKQKIISTEFLYHSSMKKIFLIYGTLALIHIFIQIFFAHLEYLRKKKVNMQVSDMRDEGYEDSVSIIIPAYNENQDILFDCIESCRSQNIRDLEVIVVDDGSTNRKVLVENVYEKFKNDGIVHIFYQDNAGKRFAQKLGFDNATKNLIVTVDSDTIIHDRNAVKKLIQPLKDKKVGAVTGDVRVENENKNIVSKLINYRYWVAFNQERAAQSLFSVVMCCSGPFSVYRKEIIDTVKDKYINQIFLGSCCTYGDDRHLTNMVLSKGWTVEYNPNAEAFTYVPIDISTYIKQQIRWNRSFYREMIWTIPFLYKKNIYLFYDMLMQLILPVCLVLALLYTVFLTIQTLNFVYMRDYCIVLILIALLRSLYGFYRTKDIGFLSFVFYGFIHILLLVPIRIYSFFTLKSIKWGTR